MIKFSFLVSILLFIINCGEIKNVSFADDVQPILEDRCIGCHFGNNAEGNVDLSNYEMVIGSRYKNHATPMVVAGNPIGSRLYIVINTRNKSMRMPPERLGENRLSESEIKTIKVWIEEGAKNN